MGILCSRQAATVSGCRVGVTTNSAPAAIASSASATSSTVPTPSATGRTELATKQRDRRESAGCCQGDLDRPQTSREKRCGDLAERGIRACANYRHDADVLQFVGGQFVGKIVHSY
jgi:hypothetical protein